MNKKNRRPFVAAGALFVALSAPLILFSREPGVRSEAGRVRPVPAVPHPNDTEGAPRSEPAPQAIASLFVAAPPHSTESPRPAGDAGLVVLRPAPLRYVGWTAMDAARSFLFVDGTTGRVLRISPGRPQAGWALLEVTSDRFLLSNGFERFTAPRR